MSYTTRAEGRWIAPGTRAMRKQKFRVMREMLAGSQYSALSELMYRVDELIASVPTRATLLNLGRLARQFGAVIIQSSCLV